MNPSLIAKALVAVSAIAGLIGTQADLVPAKYTPVLAVIAAAATASASAFKKFTGHWAVSLIGAGVAVSSGVTPVLMDIQASWAHTGLRWLSLAGIILGAFGKGFFGVDVSDKADSDKQPL